MRARCRTSASANAPNPPEETIENHVSADFQGGRLAEVILTGELRPREGHDDDFGVTRQQFNGESCTPAAASEKKRPTPRSADRSRCSTIR